MQEGTNADEEHLFSVQQRRLQANRQAASSSSSQMPETPEESELDKEFIKRLKVGFFQEANWQYQSSKNKLTLIDQYDNTRKVEAKMLTAGRNFSSSNGMTREMVEMANTYRNLVEDLNIDTVDFEIESSTEEDCQEFLRELRDSGLDINAISIVRINGQPLEGEALNQWIGQAINAAPRMRN